MVQLTNEERMLVNSELEKRKKSKLLAYVLLIFLGTFGIHRFFASKYISGVIQLLLAAIGYMTLWLFVGYGLLLILYIWLIIDLFLLNGIINRHNNLLEQEITYEVLASRR